MIPIKTLPIVSVRFPELKKITQQIQSFHKSTQVSYQSLGVENFQSVKKYTAVVQTTEGTTQNVFVYNKQSKVVKNIQVVKMEKEVKQVYHQSTTNQFGEVVVTSSSTTDIVKTVPEVSTVIEAITKKYKVDVKSQTTLI